MKVEEVAKRMGVSPQFVRIGLQRNALPFGVAVKLSSKWTYYINESHFERWMGYEGKKSCNVSC